MQIADKLIKLSMAVSNMPEARAFYEGKLGLQVTADFRQDDRNWWVSLAFPGGGAAVTLTTAHENMQPGTMKLYLATADVAAAHQDLSARGASVSAVNDDLFGPGSGVKWFSVQDPDGNQVLVAQA